MPSFILIHPTVWPQYTNVIDRQRTDSIGRTVLQTVAQKTQMETQRWIYRVANKGKTLLVSEQIVPKRAGDTREFLYR